MSLTIIDSTFSDNESQDGGGAIYGYDRTSLAVSGSTFAGNVSRNGGGAIYACPYYNDGSLSVVNSTFTDNKATSNSGGAIYVGASSLELVDVAFDGKSARDNGGALYSYNYSNA